MRRSGWAVLASSMVLSGMLGVTAPGSSDAAVRVRPSPGKIDVTRLSSGAKAWFQGPQSGAVEPRQDARRIAFGSNVDANDPQGTSLPVRARPLSRPAGATVVSAWNDATGFLVSPSTQRRASLTGLGLSTDGGRSFRDLIGLRNNTPNQQWFGDPSDHRDRRPPLRDRQPLPAGQFIDCSAGPARLQLAVEVLTVASERHGVSGSAGRGRRWRDVCALDTPAPSTRGRLLGQGVAFLRQCEQDAGDVLHPLLLRFRRPERSGPGRARASPGAGRPGRVEQGVLGATESRCGPRSSPWSTPAPTSRWLPAATPTCPGNATSTRTCSTATRTCTSTQHGCAAADVSPVVGGPALPRVVSLGQRNSNGLGGVKSLDAVVIAGYNRGTGQDFPRIAVDAPKGKVVVVWNDASAHPLGDIWLRALPMNLDITGPISKVNDDNSFALHFLPALSVRGDGSVSISWYDRRIAGPTRPGLTTSARPGQRRTAPHPTSGSPPARRTGQTPRP